MLRTNVDRFRGVEILSCRLRKRLHVYMPNWTGVLHKLILLV